MKDFKISKAQEKLLADYLAGEDVAEQLLAECQEHPELLKEVSSLIAQARILSGELDSNNHTEIFVEEVNARINDRQQPSLSEQVNLKLIDREAANNWLDKPWTMAASIAAFVCFIFIASLFEDQRDFATVTKIAAVSNNEQRLFLGNTLGQGDIELAHGFSEVTLKNGVVLVLEAPVNLTLNSPDNVTVHHGKLVARVPQNAIGFRIDTPSAEIIDLGTEFGVDVNANGESQVHVLDGEVKARANKKQSYQHVKKDQALSFDLANKIEHITSNPKEFMRVLPGKSAVKPSYLHWSFNNKKADAFTENSRGFDDHNYPAYDMSAEGNIKQITGVYGQAIEFNGNGDWLKTEFPGIESNHPRTVSFWVKIPSDFSTDNAYGILSWGLQEDYASWQISPNPETENGELGRLRIGTYKAQVVGSTDLRDDQWHHVAVVLYGGETSDISTHILLYVNGKLEKTKNKSIAKINTQLDHPKSRPLTLGRNIGYNPKAKHVSQNYFKGSVDELFVVEAALDQQQIKTLMEENRLY
ncbi:LamG-like jellyroll fold domain-containing protein [Thalassotalea agariperforans]